MLVRVASYLIFGGLTVHLAFFDPPRTPLSLTPIFKERFGAFVASVAAMYFASFMLWQRRNVLVEQERLNWSVYPVFLVVTNVLTVWALTAEVLRASEGPSREFVRYAALSVLWTAYGVELL